MCGLASRRSWGSRQRENIAKKQKIGKKGDGHTSDEMSTQGLRQTRPLLLTHVTNCEDSKTTENPERLEATRRSWGISTNYQATMSCQASGVDNLSTLSPPSPQGKVNSRQNQQLVCLPATRSQESKARKRPRRQQHSSRQDLPR